jgi:hypothetical protein
VLWGVPALAQVPLSSTVPVGPAAHHRLYSPTTAVNTVSGIVAESGAETVTAAIYGTLAYGAPTTVPATVTLDLTHGQIDCQSVEGAVTIQGPLVAGAQPVFVNCQPPASSGGATHAGGISFAGNTHLGEVTPQMWGAIPDDGLSDLEAFNGMFEALKTRGGGAVYLPPGVYAWPGAPTGSYTQPSYVDTFTREGSNLVIRGAGRGVSILEYPGGFGVRLGNTRADSNRICGGTLPFNPPTSCTGSVYAQGIAPAARIVDAPAGERAITLLTLSDVSKFAVGDVIFLESDIATTVGNAPAHYEYNDITAIDTGTGVLSLLRPLSMNFTTTNSNWPPFVFHIPVVPENITLRDFTVRGTHAGGVTNSGLHAYGVRKVRLENLEFLDVHNYASFSEDVEISNSWFHVTAGVDSVTNEFIDAVKRLNIHDTFFEGGSSVGLASFSVGGRIHHNTIFPPSGGPSLKLSADLSHTELGMEVSHNLIWVDGSQIGISVSNLVGVTVADNDIYTTPEATSTNVGIGLAGTNSHIDVVNNRIVSLNPTTGNCIRLSALSGAESQTYIRTMGNRCTVPERGIWNNSSGGGTVDQWVIVQNEMLGVGTPLVLGNATNVTLDVNLPPDGGIRWVTGTRPTCDSGHRGTVFYVAGAAGMLDTFELCRKDAGNAYAWVSLF